jgi:2-keto-4-pentenoate hydratase/2-oxohepta-3-ene-1,7-dioic acid hydratase in catechol pathway
LVSGIKYLTSVKLSPFSQGTTLEPGSIILTGTPKGVGFVKKPPIYLQDGDIVNVWLGHGIGTLVNDVKEEKSSEIPKL